MLFKIKGERNEWNTQLRINGTWIKYKFDTEAMLNVILQKIFESVNNHKNEENINVRF
jgi:hypothetical protein